MAEEKGEDRQTPIVLGVDIGGSKLMAGLVDAAGEVLAEKRHEWSSLKPEILVRDIIQAAWDVMAARPGFRPLALGATIPGLADARRGIWVESSFSGIKGLPLASLLKEAFNLPVFILNDIQACALAERRFGCCQATDDYLWVTVSNGIGGAVFSGGRLLAGSRGNAGEIGHVVVAEGASARKCKCGNRGCAEIHASGRAIPQNYRQLGGREGMDARDIAALALQGDETAKQTWQLEGVLLGRAISAAVNLLNPARVVIGGGVSQSFSLFEQPLLDTLRARVYHSANPDLEVLPSPLGERAGLLGAATLALRGLEEYAQSASGGEQ